MPPAPAAGAEPESYSFGCVLLHDIRCSNNCVFCRAGEKDLPDDLPRAAEIKLFRDTVGIVRRGIVNLNVSGNEPLRYSKILAYLRWARPYFERITLLDPGNGLEDEAFARELVETDVDTIVIPLYGSTRRVHGRCVGNEEAFDRVTRGIANLLRLKRVSQRVEITSVVLRQNHEDMAALARLVRDRFGLDMLVVNSPMATEEAVGRFFATFDVGFERLRQVVLELARIDAMGLFFRYVPACLFEAGQLEELAQRGTVRLFNAYYSYNLADSEENARRIEYVNRYREQVRVEACRSCALSSRSGCGGILRMHRDANARYPFHPIDERLLERIRPLLRFQRVND
jgi:MoaA/NifB/PqqE/SkfB family radical SAM enzyme